MPTKTITLCADDYGLNKSISEGILELITKKRISATSCLVTSQHFNEYAQLLKPYLNEIDLGLHFNLTEGSRFSCLNSLILKTKLHLLVPEEIKGEFCHQLDQFIRAFGEPPDFIDGHQHIHQFPIIDDAILKVYSERLSNKPYVRYVHHHQHAKNFLSSLKTFFINFACDREFKNKLHKLIIPHNKTFAGIYNFFDSKNYHLIFPQFLQTIENGSLIMCHPAHENTNSKDPIAKARYDEFQYFTSNQFIEDCKLANVVISKFDENVNS